MIGAKIQRPLQQKLIGLKTFTSSGLTIMSRLVGRAGNRDLCASPGATHVCETSVRLATPFWYWNDCARVSYCHMRTPTPEPQIATMRHTRREGERGISYRFGRRLRELRKERGMTQDRMATEFGINRSYLSQVEKGKKSIGLEMAEVIALGFKISLSELLRDL
jgi:DNA-binding XRE family transcriptional regulator